MLRIPPRRRVALLYLTPKEMADFVKTDLRLLQERYEVRPVCYDGRLHGWLDAIRILFAVATTDVSVSWFAHRQAHFAVWFSRMFRKPSVVILGGFDVASEERFSLTISDRDESRLGWTLDKATVLMANSHHLAERAHRFTARDDIAPVPLGFDPGRFSPDGLKDGSVVTVAYIRQDYLERKGLLTFVRAARYLPESQFYLIGKALDDSVHELRREAPTNATLTGWLPEDELVAHLRRASVYVQASRHEGFGSAVAQAMLCECVPVVSRLGALPEVVGDSGIYVDPNEPEEVARGIRQALDTPTLGRAARVRISSLFPLAKRRDALLAALDGLLR